MNIGFLIAGVLLSIVAGLIGLFSYELAEPLNHYLTSETLNLIWWLVAIMIAAFLIVGLAKEHFVIILTTCVIGASWIATGVWKVNHFDSVCQKTPIVMTIDGLPTTAYGNQCKKREFLFSEYGEYDFPTIVTIVPDPKN